MAEKPMKEKLDILFSEREEEIKNKEEIKAKKSWRFFKAPKRVTAGAKKKIKKNRILLWKVSTTGNINPEWVKLQDRMVWNKDAGAYQLADNEYHMTFMGKYPCLIVFEPTMKPFSLKNYIGGLSDIEKDSILLQLAAVKIAKMEALDLKKKGLGGKNVIWIGLIVIVALYMLMKAFGLEV